MVYIYVYYDFNKKCPFGKDYFHITATLIIVFTLMGGTHSEETGGLNSKFME